MSHTRESQPTDPAGRRQPEGSGSWAPSHRPRAPPGALAPQRRGCLCAEMAVPLALAVGPPKKPARLSGWLSGLGQGERRTCARRPVGACWRVAVLGGRDAGGRGWVRGGSSSWSLLLRASVSQLGATPADVCGRHRSGLGIPGEGSSCGSAPGREGPRGKRWPHEAARHGHRLRAGPSFPCFCSGCRPSACSELSAAGSGGAGGDTLAAWPPCPAFISPVGPRHSSRIPEPWAGAQQACRLDTFPFPP